MRGRRLIVNEHGLARLALARKHIPNGRRQFAAGEVADIRKAAGGDDDGIGLSSSTRSSTSASLLRWTIDAEPIHFVGKPPHDAREALPPGPLRGQYDLAAEFSRRPRTE